MIPKHQLPPDIERHVRRVLRRTDWDAVAQLVGDVCDGCPWRAARHDAAPDDEPPCVACPLWGARVDLAELRLLRRLLLGGSGSSAKQ